MGIAASLLSSTVFTLRSLPHIIAAFWILLSAFYDIDLVLQQSLFLCIYLYVVNKFETFIAFYLNIDSSLFSSFLNSSPIAVLFAATLGLSPFSKSSSALTSFATFLYGLFLQLIEPILMFVEMVQVIRFIFNFGDRLRNKIYDEGDESFFYKTITLIISAFNYILAIFITYQICKYESPLMALLAIIILIINVLLTVVTITNEHIVIDASLIVLYTSFLISLASIESHAHSFKLNFVENRQQLKQHLQLPEQNDLLFALLSQMERTFAVLKKGFLSIALQLSPFFWAAFLLRIKCLTSFLEGELCRMDFGSTNEMNDDDDDDGDAYVRFDSTTPYFKFVTATLGTIMPSRAGAVRIAAIVGFTSIILQRFATGTFFVFIQYQSIVRILQTFAASIFYLFALRVHNEQQEQAVY